MGKLLFPSYYIVTDPHCSLYIIKHGDKLVFCLKIDAKAVNPVLEWHQCWTFCGSRFFMLQTFWKIQHWDPFPQMCFPFSLIVCLADVTSLTSTIIISEELLTVICRVGFFHLSNSISGYFSLKRWGEKGWAIVAFWGRRCAERRELKENRRNAGEDFVYVFLTKSIELFSLRCATRQSHLKFNHNWHLAASFSIVVTMSTAESPQLQAAHWNKIFWCISTLNCYGKNKIMKKTLSLQSCHGITFHKDL